VAYDGIPYVTPGGSLAVTIPFVAIVTAIFVGVVISRIEFRFYRPGFLRLRPADDRFARAPTYSLLAFIGLILLALARGTLLALLARTSCASGATSFAVACTATRGLAAAGLLAVVGVIAFVVGAIGALVATWRLGVRSGDGRFKAAAVLFIFPFLNLIATILVIVATSSVEKRLPMMPGGPASTQLPTAAPMTSPPPPS
jgi:hypothetical protein